MATFTQEELDFIKAHGNEECSKTWLGLLADPKARGRQQPSQDYREHIIDKYEKQRYFLSPASPLKTIGAATGLRNGAGGVSLSSSSGTVTSPSSPSSASSVNSSAAANADQNNNNNVIQLNQLNLKAIQLTPPASTRTSGRHHQQQPNNNNNNSLNNNNSNSNISRGGFNGSSAFAEDSLFSEASTKQQQQQQWTNLNSNQGSLFGTANNNNNNNIISNGFKSNNNINNNSFGAFGQGSGPTGAAMAPPGQHMTATSTSGGFVADFGSADIFNANVINGGTNNNNIKSSNNNNNNGGLVMMNGHGERTEGGALNRSNAVKRRNGSVTAGEQQAITNNGFSNGTTAVAGQKKPEENFADFDHNPIFNSAGE